MVHHLNRRDLLRLAGANGIEAAAATAAAVAASGVPEEPFRLILDRPFGYVFVHVPTRTPLFTGVVADPRP